MNHGCTLFTKGKLMISEVIPEALISTRSNQKFIIYLIATMGKDLFGKIFLHLPFSQSRLFYLTLLHTCLLLSCLFDTYIFFFMFVVIADKITIIHEQDIYDKTLKIHIIHEIN